MHAHQESLFSPLKISRVAFQQFEARKIDVHSCIIIFRDVASAIKKLLDAASDASELVPSAHARETLGARRRDFVKHSKRFSNTLKGYFKEGK